jgi:hypothetical protein
VSHFVTLRRRHLPDGQVTTLGEVYINPKYPQCVGVKLNYTSLSVEEARTLAAELLATAELTEVASQPLTRDQEGQEAIKRGY